MSGVVNVGGGECRGGECRTISQAVVMFDDLSMGGKMRNLVIMMI